MRPFTHIATLLANRAIGGEGICRFAGRHLALSAAGKRIVWRIDGEGALLPVHPLIAADCEVKFSGGKVHLSGEGDMLKTLSAQWEQADIPVILAELLPPAAAAPFLAALEQFSAALAAAVSRHTTSAPESADFAAAVRDFSRRVDALARRVDAAQG